MLCDETLYNTENQGVCYVMKHFITLKTKCMLCDETLYNTENQGVCYVMKHFITLKPK